MTPDERIRRQTLAAQLHAERTLDAYAWRVFDCRGHGEQACQWCLRMAPRRANG